RLGYLQPRLWNDVAQVGGIANRGAALAGWSGGIQATGRPSAEDLAAKLRGLEAERRRAPEGSARAASLARSEDAVAAQIRALHEAEEAEAMVLDRLRVIVARLDQTVTS